MGEYEYYQRHDLYYSNWRLLIGCADSLTAQAKATSTWIGRRLRDSGDPIVPVFVYGNNMGWEDYKAEVDDG